MRRCRDVVGLEGMRGGEKDAKNVEENFDRIL